MSENKVQKWLSKKEAYSRALQHMAARKKREIVSLKCSLEKINQALTDGFEFGTVVAWAARPSVGKSVLKEQLIREFFELNPTVQFRVLDFDLEMSLLVTAIREFSSVTGKSYKALCSAEGEVLSRDEYMMCYHYAQQKVQLKSERGDYPIDVVEEPPTVEEFIQIVNEYMEFYSYQVDGVKTYPNVVISIDHCRLIKRAYQGQSEPDMLYELSASINGLKKKYPEKILFLLLNHLGRGFVEHTRCEDGKNANYPVESDVHGSDSLSQNVDVLFALDIPAKRRIRYFGPERFIIEDETVMMITFLKARNGDLRSSFLRTQFAQMKVVDMDTPPCAKKVSKLEEQREQ